MAEDGFGKARSRPAIKAQSIATPKGGGAITGLGENAAADQQSGSFSLTVPLAPPPARGLEPDLALSYTSTAGQGEFGLGFALSLGAISRRTSRGTPRYDGRDVFVWGRTELCPVQGAVTVRNVGGHAYSVARYRLRVEESFDLIEHWIGQDGADSFWRTVSADNRMTFYGRGPEARVADPARPGRVFSWLPEWEFDARGNALRYRYKAEDGAGVAIDAINEVSRTRTANRYLERVCYANDAPLAPAPDGSGLPDDILWHFEIVLDYGEYRVDPGNDKPYQPVQPWLVRPDPFSTYVAGFERRTYRLCRNVLTFHRFDVLGSDPVLTRAFALGYKLDPSGSQLAGVTLTGYRYRGATRPAGKRYVVKAMPSLTFGYTGFDPGAARFMPFGGAGLPLPEVARPPRSTLTDLFGEGVPGLLYADAMSTFYCAPEKTEVENGAPVGYDAPSSLQQLPNLSMDGPSVIVTDLDGDGCQEVVLTQPGAAGFFRANPDHSWNAFQPLDAFPTDYQETFSEFVDVTGDGRADLVRVRRDSVAYYKSMGTRGYDEPAQAPNDTDVPPLNVPAADRLTLFTDLLGAGTAQRVRLVNGRIDCWPILGYGRFAAAVTPANAPRVAGQFDVARVYIADLDGSGPADVIFAYADRIEIFFNQSGNAFATAPFVLALPASYSSRDQITFADLFGTGCQCLIFSNDDPVPRVWTYDFSNGQKPYLLKSIDNGSGTTTTVTYDSSVGFYLRDKRAGRPWITNLPFPVQVVARLERHDAISDTREVSTYRYRHGYYDGVEREFRGFAMVERQDAETLLPSSAAQAPPMLERVWYHTGAQPRAGPVSQLLAREYFARDPKAYAMPADVFLWPNGFVPDPETLRQAHVALAGTMLRSEIYGLDGSPLQNVPLTATQANSSVRLLQPRTEPGNLATFFAHEREAITYDYERAGDDPRVAHNFVLEVDDYGNVTRSCEVFYPRRPGQPVDDPQQAGLRAGCSVFTPAPPQLEPDMWLHGLPQAERTFEIRNIAPAGGTLYFDFATIGALVATALASGDGGDGKPAAIPLSWERWSYIEGNTGAITPQALLRNTQIAEFRAADVAAVFAPADLPGGLDAMLSGPGGYVLAEGFWWRAGPTESYGPADQFFTPLSTADAFAAQANGPPGAISTYSYDPYRLLLIAIETTSSGADVLADRIAVTRMDYQTLMPLQVEDSNGRIAEVLLDPLGIVFVTSHRGRQQVAGTPADVGFTALPEPDTGDWPVPASAADAIANAAHYLQGASSFIHTDVDSWRRDGIPAHTVEIEASEYPDPAHPTDPVGDIRIRVDYDDGFGRIVQSTRKVEPGEAIQSQSAPDGAPVFAAGVLKFAPTNDRWLTAGATIFNNKNQPYKQYEPFYRDSWTYTDNAELRSFGSSPTFYYDALSRPARTGYQKGTITEAFFSKVERTPWSVTSSDENDTIKDSAYYRAYVDPGGTMPPLPPYDKDALVKAAAHDATPSTQVLSCDGHAVRIVERLSPGDAGALVTILTIDIQGRTTAVADPRLGAAGVWNLKLSYGLGETAISTVNADAGTSYSLSNVLGNPLLALDARRQLVTHSYDGCHRVTAVLLRDLSAQGPVRMTERVIYGDSLDQHGQPPFPDSDARNLRGQIWAHYDEAGQVEVPAYSIVGAPLSSSQRFTLDARTDPDWSVTMPAGWSWAGLTAKLAPMLGSEAFASAYAYDALNEPTIDTDPGGNQRRIERHVSGRVKAMFATPKGEAEFPFLQDVAYTANDQRSQLTLAAPAGTGFATRTYSYDPDTLSLLRLQTARHADAKALQDLNYFYDPVGNVTHVQDQSGVTSTVVRNGQTISPDLDFTFDALYRLTAAQGRAHLGITSDAEADGGYGQVFANLNDASAVEAYLMRYCYDNSGNLTRTRYMSPASAPSSRWTRTMSVAPNSNRAVDASALAGGSIDSWFDANGNQIKSAGLPSLGWSYRNELRQTILIDRGPDADPDAQYCVYDATGKRVRTLIQRKTAAGLQTEETLYLGNLEITRSRQGTELVTESRRLRLMDVESCIAERLIWTVGAPPAGVSQPQLRYQLDNEQGSAMMEVDGAGNLISYEEYSPYGSTVYATGASLAEVSLKQYRYSGKNRDQVTGFYYYGARHYAPWLGRWLSPDPSGTADGLNLYAFLGGNPVTHVDADGMGKTKKSSATPKVSHRSLHTESEQIGRLIAQEMGSDTTPVQDLRDKYAAVIKEAGGEFVHNEKKVIEAIAHGLDGDNKAFADAYRAAAKGTDEHMSTTTVFHVLKGIGSVTKTFSKENKEKLTLAVKIASVFRLPTEQSGHNFGGGESKQHPASQELAVFDRSAKNHGSADLYRRLMVVRAGSEGTGFQRLLNMAAEGALHTLNEFVAPPTAKNQHFRKKLSTSFKRKYTKRRELTKRQYLILKGRNVDKYLRQRADANYRRRTERTSSGKRLDRSPSPIRDMRG
jgi:insecticidal toxin complex protein TccC